VSKRASHKALITSFLSSSTMCLGISLMIIGVVHAEQYCKSVDKDGNATYTLASKNGCHAKKMKTVAIHHFIMPAVPATPNTQKPTDVKPTELKSNPTQEKSPSTSAPVAVVVAPAAAVAPAR
jgi:hypothetical protein